MRQNSATSSNENKNFDRYLFPIHKCKFIYIFGFLTHAAYKRIKYKLWLVYNIENVCARLI